MFDNHQSVTSNCIDNRILPPTGIIKLVGIISFIYYHSNGNGWKNWETCRDTMLPELVKELEQNNIPIFRLTDDTHNWMIRLDDFKPILNGDK